MTNLAIFGADTKPGQRWVGGAENFGVLCSGWCGLVFSGVLQVHVARITVCFKAMQAMTW